MALTAEQIAQLQAAAAGNIQLPGTNMPQVQVNQYPGCDQGGGVGATQFSVPTDVSKFNTEQCGLMSLYVNSTSSNFGAARTLILGGGHAGATGCSQIATDIFEILLEAGGSLADLDLANVIGVDSPNFNPTDCFNDWINALFSARNMVFSGLNIQGESGNDLTSIGKIRKYSLSPEGDWEVCNPKLQRNFCAPCFNNDDNSQVRYDGFLPVSAVDALAIKIPTGVNLTFEFCVFEYENAKNMTKCA